jgi:predicted nucleic acid-binding protein
LNAPKIVVHTDLFLDHLRGSRHPSSLRQAMGKFFCYTTVFQAIELFSLAESEEERKAIEDSMAAMKIMGLNPKQARKYGTLLNRAKRLDTLNILIAGLCLESKLPILTDRKQDFKGIKGLTIVPTRLLLKLESGQEMLGSVRA